MDSEKFIEELFGLAEQGGHTEMEENDHNISIT